MSRKSVSLSTFLNLTSSWPRKQWIPCVTLLSITLCIVSLSVTEAKNVTTTNITPNVTASNVTDLTSESSRSSLLPVEDRASRDGSGKKKVVIIGEMSDLAFEMATNASASSYALDDVTFGDHDDFDHLPPPPPLPLPPEEHHHPASHRFPHHYSSRYHHRYPHPYPSPSSYSGSYSSSGGLKGRGGGASKRWITKKTVVGPPVSSSSSSPGSVFVPVAAYSVTHSRVGPNGVRRMKPVIGMKHHPDEYYPMISAGSSPAKTTESAVYGYVQKPEIVEFRGQYFYGPNPTSSHHHHSHASHHHPHYHHHEPVMSASSSSGWFPSLSSSPGSSRISNKSGGLGPGGLLLATLPLILAPMLSYLFTPMVIPVTATIAAGRRRRSTNNSRKDAGDIKSSIFRGMNSNSREERLVRAKQLLTQSLQRFA